MANKVLIDWKRFLRLAGFALLVVALMLVGLHILSAWLYAYYILHPGCVGGLEGLQSAGYEAEPIEFLSRDGRLILRGWYTRGTTHPEIAIIVTSNYGANTFAAIPDALIHAESGYSVLLFEPRYCATGTGEGSTGYFESLDVLGAVDYLKSRPDVEHIGAHGLSAGGTAILLAAAQEPAIEALIAMGGYPNLEQDILDAGTHQSLYERSLRRLIAWSTSIQLGVPVRDVDPIGVISRISPRPILLIYGEYEAADGRLLYQAAGEPKELWLVPGSGHTYYGWVAPEEYRRRVTTFFQVAFQQD